MASGRERMSDNELIGPDIKPALAGKYSEPNFLNASPCLGLPGFMSQFKVSCAVYKLSYIRYPFRSLFLIKFAQIKGIFNEQ